MLCREAAKYGIGIVLDGVFSHTGSDSRYFNREGRYGEGGAYRDPNSPYRSWYDFDPKYKGGYRSWWGFETLPEVNEETPSFVEFITGEGGVIDTWLRRGAAGFRLLKWIKPECHLPPNVCSLGKWLTLLELSKSAMKSTVIVCSV